MEVRREIAQRTGRDAAIGAVYATLERLRDKGFLRAREAASDNDTGRMRRAYQVTAEGRRALDQALDALAKMREGVRLAPKATSEAGKRVSYAERHRLAAPRLETAAAR